MLRTQLEGTSDIDIINAFIWTQIFSDTKFAPSDYPANPETIFPVYQCGPSSINVTKCRAATCDGPRRPRERTTTRATSPALNDHQGGAKLSRLHSLSLKRPRPEPMAIPRLSMRPKSAALVHGDRGEATSATQHLPFWVTKRIVKSLCPRATGRRSRRRKTKPGCPGRAHP